LQLHDWQVDFACWCSYKYLNSGPGGVAGVFIHGKHISDTRLPRFAGWWGHSKSTRFKMEAGFNPIPTAEGWQLSNAPIFSMAAHKASLDIFMEAGMDRIFEKAKLLSAWTWFVLEDINGGGRKKILEVITPSDPGARGCQLSILMMENGKKIFDGLSDAGIITDWREPNVIRIAPVALYNKFEEVWELGNTLKEMIGKF
jgi:kynureninase